MTQYLSVLAARFAPESCSPQRKETTTGFYDDGTTHDPEKWCSGFRNEIMRKEEGVERR
jgi:hypothetical protein